MRSVTYGGRDLGRWCMAEAEEPAAQALEPAGVEVPGRPGLVPCGSSLPPRAFRVRLMMDAGATMTAEALAAARRELRSWLCAPDGAELVLPGDPGLAWRDCFVTGVSGWSDLFEGGECTVELTCLDPVAWGEERVERGTHFTVGGTWETWPSVRLVARAGGAAMVGLQGSGARVAVSRALAAGDVVEVDMAARAVAVNGAAADADVDVGSEFFALAPGPAAVEVAGASSFEVRYVERWL